MKIKVVRPIFTYTKGVDQDTLLSQCMAASNAYGQDGKAITDIKHVAPYLREDDLECDQVQVIASVEYDLEEFQHFVSHIGALLEVAHRTLEIEKCRDVVQEINKKMAEYIERNREEVPVQ